MPATVSATLGEFSPREREVIRQITLGASIKEIAYGLGISPNTVKTYLKAVFQKTQVHSARELMLLFRPRLGQLMACGAQRRGARSSARPVLTTMPAVDGARARRAAALISPDLVGSVARLTLSENEDERVAALIAAVGHCTAQQVSAEVFRTTCDASGQVQFATDAPLGCEHAQVARVLAQGFGQVGNGGGTPQPAWRLALRGSAAIVVLKSRSGGEVSQDELRRCRVLIRAAEVGPAAGAHPPGAGLAAQASIAAAARFAAGPTLLPRKAVARVSA